MGEETVRLKLGLRGLSSDVHSADAAIIPSAVWRLAWALSALKNEKEEVLIPGLCADGKEALNITGMNAGYSGPGSKTVIPAEAWCQVNICPAEGLSGEAVCARVREHLGTLGFEDIQVSLC